MNQKTTTERSERILVALDASPHSEAALRAAVELAALMEVEVEGLFIEDINLVYLSGFPFGHEIGSYTAALRRLDNRSLERQLHGLATAIRRNMERIAAPVHVQWSFEVRRGVVGAELLAAAQSAAMISLGRASRRRRKTLGSTAQYIVSQTSRPVLILDEDGELKYPLTVLYTGSAAADRSLQLALPLVRRNKRELRVLVWAGDGERFSTEQLQTKVQQMLADQNVEFQVETVGQATDLLKTIRAGDGGTLILPRERSFLLSEHNGPTILVP